MQKSISKI